MINPPPHSRRLTTSDDWITPRWLIRRLGHFDLDPCRSLQQPWRCARRGFTVNDDGLTKPWKGFVWMNPPYGRICRKWLSKLAEHDNGIALVFARTDTRMFFESVWGVASSLLFVQGRLTFCYPGSGAESLPGHNSGGPSVLIGYGAEAAKRLATVQDLGTYFDTGGQNGTGEVGRIAAVGRAHQGVRGSRAG